MIPMKWLAIVVGLAALLAVAIAGRESTRETKVKALASAVIGETKPMEERTAQPAIAAVRPMALPVSEKAVRVEKIRADYDTIRKGVADELAAASAAGPGPYGDTRVFLRRLALLEREQHADLAQVLEARELEDFELRESSTGQLVATLDHGNTSVVVQGFAPGGDVFLTTTGRVARLWSADGRLLHTLDRHADDIELVRFSPSGKWLAVCAGSRVYWWNVETGAADGPPVELGFALRVDDGDVMVWCVSAGAWDDCMVLQQTLVLGCADIRHQRAWIE